MFSYLNLTWTHQPVASGFGLGGQAVVSDLPPLVVMTFCGVLRTFSPALILLLHLSLTSKPLSTWPGDSGGGAVLQASPSQHASNPTYSPPSNFKPSSGSHDLETAPLPSSSPNQDTSGSAYHPFLLANTYLIRQQVLLVPLSLSQNTPPTLHSLFRALTTFHLNYGDSFQRAFLPSLHLFKPCSTLD